MPAHVIKKVWPVFIFDLAVGVNIKKSSKLNLHPKTLFEIWLNA